MNLDRKIAQTITQHASGMVVILLLFVYVIGSSNLESLYGFFHEHESTVLHAEQNEADPCHVSLYHQESDGGCEHDSHLVKEYKCSLCDVQFHSAQIVEGNAIALPVTFCVVSSSNSFELYVDRIDSQSAGRAPPIS